MFESFELFKDYFGMAGGKMQNVKGLKLNNITPTGGRSKIVIDDLKRAMNAQGITTPHSIDMSFFRNI